MSYVKDWDTKKLINHVSGQLLSGMDAACSFAAEEARARAPRAGGTLQDEIDYEVKPKRNVITGYVGVKKGKAYYGYFQELGTRFHAAHPFLRPAVFDNADEIVRLLTEG